MEFTHPLCDLFGGFWYSEIRGCQRAGVKELFESAVGESSQKSGSNLLASQASQDL